MARTRIDPWQAEQPELIWKSSTLAALIPRSPSPSFFNHGAQRFGPKVLLPNRSLHSPPQLELNNISSPILKSNPHKPHSNSTKPSSHGPSHSKNSHSSSSHSSSTTIPSSFSKHPSKHKSKKKDEFASAASKVLAALNQSSASGPFHNPPDFNYGLKLKLKKRKRLGLPEDDKRKNMVSSETVSTVPKVVLQDIGFVISKVCPKLSSTSPTGMENELEIPSSPKMPLLSPHSKASAFPMQNNAEKNVEAPQLNKEPTIVTLDDSVAQRLPSISPARIHKGISEALLQQGRKSPVVRSEKSSTPVSIKEATFASLALAAPSFLNSPILHSTSTWPSSSKCLPSYPVESVSSLSSKSPLSSSPRSPSRRLYKPSPELKESSVLRSRSDNPKVSLSKCEKTSGVFLDKTSVTERTNMSPAGTESQRQSTRLRSSTSTPSSTNEPQNCSKSVALHPIRNGFLGFSQEDGKKLKVRFHVNTNILASSLDLLDLHKNAGMPSGSPSTCSHCNMIFSSVKHCKYHQSFMSSNVALDSSRHNDVQEDGVWLCPWCPLMCTSINLLDRHKLECREKGHCQQEQKASSVRKSASSSSRRRITPITSVNEMLASPNRYKVVHGQVIQL